MPVKLDKYDPIHFTKKLFNDAEHLGAIYRIKSNIFVPHINKHLYVKMAFYLKLFCVLQRVSFTTSAKTAGGSNRKTSVSAL